MVTPRKSRILEKIRAGKKALSFKINLSCPRVAEIAALSGFDGEEIVDISFLHSHDAGLSVNVKPRVGVKILLVDFVV